MTTLNGIAFTEQVQHSTWVGASVQYSTGAYSCFEDYIITPCKAAFMTHLQDLGCYI